VKLLIVGVPFTVIKFLYGDSSMNILDLQVNNVVFAIAVNGNNTGVKLDVYTAVPFTMRTFEM